jgi:HEAT repeat protein/ATP/ADP translocase
MATTLNLQQPNPNGFGRKLLQWFNLRPEETERTALMFSYYVAFSIGMTWLEASTVALFLKECGIDYLPWIAIATAFMGSLLGTIYSRLQQFLPMRQLVVLVPVMMALLLLAFRFGLELPSEPLPSALSLIKLTLLQSIIFLLRLWTEAVFTINELNTSIAANQLFNIREIKRTYPIISSGVLVADLISGFMLWLILLSGVTLYDMVVISSLMMLIGSGMLFYLCSRYRQAFPDVRRYQRTEVQTELETRRIQGPLKQYTIALVLFFVVEQLLLELIEFQFYDQLEGLLNASQIAITLGIFNGILGFFEVFVQWFLSSRAIERWGVFVTAAILPGLIVILSFFSLIGLTFGVLENLLGGLVILKFFDELLRYTLVTSTSPVLFQPIPDEVRSQVQSLRGISDPLSSGAMGVVILLTLFVMQRLGLENTFVQDRFLLSLTVVFGLVWILSVLLLRRGYVDLLVRSAERGQLSGANLDLRALKQAVIGALENQSPEVEKRSCIELLSQLYPETVAEVLAPLLKRFTPKLQQKSLEIMLAHPSSDYLEDVRELLEEPIPPEVLAVALRYVWLVDPNPDLERLRPYLRSNVDAIVRGTVAALMLRLGTVQQKAEATHTLRRMLTHKRERERVMGCKALGDAAYMQALRIYIPDLLQDQSLRVRRAILEAIAATHLEEYYPSLIRGLYYSSTRESAMNALIRLENEVVPRLVNLACDPQKPSVVRMHAWNVIGQIGTYEALDELVLHLTTSWGLTRRNILRILLKLPYERGINAVLDRLEGRLGVENLVDQELVLIGQLYAALVDMPSDLVPGAEADLLRRALRDQQMDAFERIFLLLRFLYPASSIQAAAFCLQSKTSSSVARGIEILDNTVDLPNKWELLIILDRRSDAEKLESLVDLITYTPLPPSDRLRHLLDLRHFLDDWPLACCFHLAARARWSLTAEQALACIRHPTGFVREAVLGYLHMASPRALIKILPLLQTDPAPLVANQAQKLLKGLEDRRRLQEKSS